MGNTEHSGRELQLLHHGIEICTNPIWKLGFPWGDGPVVSEHEVSMRRSPWVTEPHKMD